MADPESDSKDKTERELPGVAGEATRLTDRKVELAYKIADKIADAHDLPLPHGVPNQGSVKAVLDGAREVAMAYKVKQELTTAWADASHGAQQQSPNQAQKAENDARESIERADKAKEFFQKEKEAKAELEKQDDYKKKSFEDKAKELDGEFKKSNQTQLEYKNQQDNKYKELAGEQAKVSHDLAQLNEGARQEHQKWRQDVVGNLCKDEATAQVDKKIVERVGDYQNRINEMGSKFLGDGKEMVEKFKVQLEEKKPEQIQQKAADLQKENFKSTEVPSIAPPSVAPPAPDLGSKFVASPSVSAPGSSSGPGAGPGGGGPGGR